MISPHWWSMITKKPFPQSPAFTVPPRGPIQVSPQGGSGLAESPSDGPTSAFSLHTCLKSSSSASWIINTIGEQLGHDLGQRGGVRGRSWQLMRGKTGTKFPIIHILVSPASPLLSSLWIFAWYSNGQLRAGECGLLAFMNPEGKKKWLKSLLMLILAFFKRVRENIEIPHIYHHRKMSSFQQAECLLHHRIYILITFPWTPMLINWVRYLVACISQNHFAIWSRH